MNTLFCSKHSFHTFAEHQGWLLLFDKMTDDKSEVGYMLQTGSVIFAVFANGEFDHMSDTTNASLSVNSQEENEDE